MRGKGARTEANVRKPALTALVGVLIAGVAAGESRYAGQETRDIKALSPQQVEGYRKGRGMGYARAAELNGYPGPRHVLDLAGELNLSDEQLERTRDIHEAMKREASRLGKQLVEKERALDEAFAGGSIDEASLRSLVEEIAALEARIRRVHLLAHLEQRALLRDRQVRRYVELRGYRPGRDHAHDPGHRGRSHD